MVDKKVDSALIAYIFGIASIVMAIFTPLAGVVFGIIGIMYSKKEKSPLAKKAKKFSTIGIIIGGLLFLISFASAIYIMINGGEGVFQNFPLQ